MKQGGRTGTRALLGVGLMVCAGAMTLLANKVETPFFKATSESELEVLEDKEVRVLGPGAGPFSVSYELKDNWRYDDTGETTRDEYLRDETGIFRKIVRMDEEEAMISLLYPHDPHLRTASIVADGFPKHRLYLYPVPEQKGVRLDGSKPTWKVEERARHKTSGIVPLAVKDLKTDMVIDPAVEGGIYPHGEYESTFSTSWSWPQCACGACYAQASATTINEVHALSLEQGEASDGYKALGEKDWNIAYIGLDRTAHSTPAKISRKVKAKIVDQFEGRTEYEWSVGPGCVSMGANNAEEFEFGIKDATKATPSKEFMDQQLSCKATISGCHDDCRAEATVVTNFTIVAVDVTIAMADCEKSDGEEYPCEAAEKIEEAQGAFIHYEDDHGMKPFSPRGSNALTRVWFSIKPDNLPKDDKVLLSFPEDALWEGTQRRGNMVYTPAKPEYTVGDLKNKSFFLHGHKPSEKICDHEITIEHVKSGAKDRAKYTVVELDLVPDFDRDHKIDADDEKKVVMQKTFYWWLNDDADEGDCASCYADKGTEVPNYPSLKNNCDDGSVNGRTDLLDFFPVWTNIGGALEICKMVEAAKSQKLSIRFKTKGIGFAQTNMYGTEAGKFLKSEGVDAFEAGLFFKSDTIDDGDIRKDGEHEFRKEYINHCIGGLNKAGIILVEGCKKETDVRIALYRGDRELFNVPMNCSIHDVGELFGILDLYMTGGSYKAISNSEFEKQCSDCDVFYLHGFKVHQSKAIGWHADAFKRLYQSGSTARFIGVTWNGYVEARHPGLYYHRCVMQAFEAGKRLATYLNEGKIKRRSKSVFMAHSLGNVVVSTAIQDYQLKPTQYFMLNAAVAAEAYDGRLQSTTDPESTYLVQENWWSDNLEEAMPKQAFSAYWHQFFVDEQSSESYKNGTKEYRESVDCRARLTWKDRFAGVLTNTVVTSYYSPQDEVFEICKDRSFWQGEGFKVVFFDEADYEFNFVGFWEWLKNSISLDLSQYCWHKQEIGKGVASAFNHLADSDMAGWGFDGADPNAAQTDPSKRARSKADIDEIMKTRNWIEFRDEPVFRRNPSEVFRADGDAFDKTKENEMLACAIPAISRAIGRSDAKYLKETRFRGVVDVKNLVNKLNGQKWGRNVAVYGEGWLHCDIKDMAYFYTWPLWNDFVKRGELRDEEVFK